MLKEKRQMSILLLVDTTIEGASPSHAPGIMIPGIGAVS
jgi:hypothetical protein